MPVDLRHFMERIHIKNQSELGKLLGKSQATISLWEKGSYPTYDMCKKLLEMGMTVEELFGEEAALGCMMKDRVENYDYLYKNQAKQALAETLQKMIDNLK